MKKITFLRLSRSTRVFSRPFYTTLIALRETGILLQITLVTLSAINTNDIF